MAGAFVDLLKKEERVSPEDLYVSSSQEAAAVSISFEGDFTAPMIFSAPLPETVSDALGDTAARAASFDLRCFTTGRFLRKVGEYGGVLLRDLITQAGLSKEPARFKRTVFIAVAQDGYTVTFSWHELFNTPVGEQVVVAYQCDNVPLSTADGAPILFSGADIVPAPRHMKRLKRVIARVVEV